MPATLQLPSPCPDAKPKDRGPEVHTIDPDGDVVLVLTRFVRFEDDESGVYQLDGSEDVEGAHSSVGKPLALLNSRNNDGGVSEEGESSGSSAGSPRCSIGSATMAVDFNTDMDCGAEEVIIRASSRHLTLASPVFRAMLHRKFSESNTLRLTGSVEIPLPDDDPDAFLVLLNILHGRIRRVPLVVDLETLTQIAILVDKYDLMEPVELFANFWFDSLKSTIPDSYTDKTPSWICISNMFNKEEEFESTTRLAMREARGEIPLAGLPVPPSVINTINNRRLDALHSIVTSLLKEVDDYLEREHCSFECDALMLGSLTKRLRTLKILPKRPEPPYNGLSFEDFNHRFRQGMYFPGAQRTSALYYSHSKCANRSVERLLTKCDEKLCGMKLEDCRVPSLPTS